MDADKKILLVEDDCLIQEMISDFFGANGWNVRCTAQGQEALSILRGEDIKLVLLDIMIPEMDGFETCLAIRREFCLPVIFLTALEAEPMQLKGYQAGADDYVTKPFSLPVLLAKVNALTQRAGQEVTKEKEMILKAGSILLYPGQHKVLAYGRECTLAEKEYQLLFYLLLNKGCVLAREQILNRVWGEDALVMDRVVDKHMVKLRNALGEAGQMIHTIPKAGYVLKDRGET